MPRDRPPPEIRALRSEVLPIAREPSTQMPFLGPSRISAISAVRPWKRSPRTHWPKEKEVGETGDMPDGRSGGAMAGRVHGDLLTTGLRWEG